MRTGSGPNRGCDNVFAALFLGGNHAAKQENRDDAGDEHDQAVDRGRDGHLTVLQNARGDGNAERAVLDAGLNAEGYTGGKGELRECACDKA